MTALGMSRGEGVPESMTFYALPVSGARMVAGVRKALCTGDNLSLAGPGRVLAAGSPERRGGDVRGGEGTCVWRVSQPR